MSYTLFTPAPEDAPALARLGATTYRDTWQPLYTNEVMERYLADAFAPEAVAASLADPRLRYWAVRDADAIIAYAKAGPLALPIATPHDACIELQRLYVHAEHKRSGLGRKLAAAFEAHVRAQKLKSAFLSVWSENHPALALYRAMGFYEVGQFYMPLGDHINYDIAPDLILRKDYNHEAPL